MHDDQHGTAIISAAALLNALELAEKSIDAVRIVINGAGAAAISCTRLYKAFGADSSKIVMIDSKGVIRKDHPNLTAEKNEFATHRDIKTLEEAMVDADVFVGLSIADIVTPKMLKSMAANPIVFAMANPDPEIKYDLAIKSRADIIMATGRSDHPNQVNNVLGFPFIFRGALDVRATKINEAMKMAAVKALADLAKEPVPEQVNVAYDETKLQFGRDYIIPKPFDPRLIIAVPPAVAKAAMESGVALAPIKDWERYEEELLDRMGNDHKMLRLLFDRARSKPKRVIFAEADHLDVIKAAQIVFEEGVAKPILLGRKEVILELMQEIDFDEDVEIIDPKSDDQDERRTAYAQAFWQLRKRKGVTLNDANRLMRERSYFGSMMINLGDADAMVSGYARAYPTALRPILETVGRFDGVDKVAATNLMLTPKGPIFISDTSINIDPTAKELANIAQMTNYTMKMFGVNPVIAMISYANFGSSDDPHAAKVREAVRLLHESNPDMVVDGELQVDFALNSEMLKNKFPFSKLAGRKVNALVFPNLDAANSNYKMLKEQKDVDSIGPIMLGLRKAVHIFQLGASVDEMVNMTAIAVVDAQQKEQAEKQQKRKKPKV